MSQHSSASILEHDPVLAHEPAPEGGSPGKRSLTQGLSPRAIIFRVESAEAARELGAAFGPRDRNGVADGAEAAVDRAGAGTGTPLRADLRERFESSLGADLSGVRVHTGADSAAASDAVGARAYTLGSDIHFGAGQYQPDDPFGVHLLAHEVAHTVQQAGGAAHPQYKLQVSGPADAAELEADRAADAMVAGRPAQVAGAGVALARKVEEKEHDKVDVKEETKERMTKAQDALATVATRAQKDGQSVLSDGDACVTAIQKALDHLTISLNLYSEAHKRVEAKLTEAQVAHEITQAVMGGVKDLILGAALGGLALEASLVKAITQTKDAQRKVVQTLGEVSQGLYSGVVSTAGGAAAAATDESPENAAPKDSLAGAGLSPGDKALDAFNKLSELVRTLPAVGKLGGSIKDIGITAGQVSVEAGKIRGGEKAQCSASEIEDKVRKLEQLAAGSATHVAKASETRQKMQAISAGITNVKQLSDHTIEDKLWTNWMASRSTPAQRDMIDNPVIEKYLISRGLMKDNGNLTTEQDENEAVTDAQKRVLADHQVTAPDDPAKVASLYKREMKCDELKRTYVGQVGHLVAENRVDVGGVQFACPGNAGGNVGDSIKVMWFQAKEHRLNPDVIVAEWQDSDFDLLGKKVEG